MESSSESKRSWPSWLLQLALIRIAGAISGLGVSYWATEHLASGAGARLIGNSSALANGLEAITALLISTSLIRAARPTSILIALGCSIAALGATLYPGEGSFWLLRAADGIIAGLATTSALSQVLGRAGSDPKGARWLVAFESIIIVSFALGSIAASILWRPFASSTFLVTAAIYIASVGVPHLNSKARTKGAKLIFSRNPLFFGVLAMSASASMWVSQVTFVLSGQKVTGQVFPGLFDKRGVAFVVVSYLIATGIGLSLWGLALAKVNIKTGSLVAVLAAIVAPILLLVSNLSAVPNPFRQFSFVFYAIALLVQTGLIPTFMAISNRGERPNDSVQLASSLIVSTAVGAIIGPWLGGFVVEQFSFSGLCVASCILAIFSLVSLFVAQVSRRIEG
jgi:hypothetical protein